MSHRQPQQAWQRPLVRPRPEVRSDMCSVILQVTERVPLSWVFRRGLPLVNQTVAPTIPCMTASVILTA